MKCLRKVSPAVLALALVLASGAAAQTGGSESFTTEEYAKYREAATNLKCQCGCSYTVADCNMLRCSFREKVKPEIREMVAAGAPAGTIIQRMVEKYGPALRTEPKAEGFGLVGWAMPFVALAVGLVAAPFFVRRWRRREAEQASEQPPADEAAVQRYEQQLEKELEELE